jgi:hypothetical protein
MGRADIAYTGGVKDMTALAVSLERESGGFDRHLISRVAGELMRREPFLAGTGLLLLAMMAPTLFAWLVETRTLYGINVWTKPLKFEASIAFYFLTLAWFWGYLSPRLREARSVRAVAFTVAACGLFEIIYIAFQAGRGVGSHFNTATPIEDLMFRLMGVAALIMTAGSLVLAILIARSERGLLPSAFRVSVVVGLLLTFLLGTGAGIVIAANGGHWVGGVASDTSGLPVFGWARDGGDLRVAHFFGIHAMQFLPVFALIALRVVPRRAVIAVAVFALALCGLTIAALLQALDGRPFLPMLG